jgi:hypothetical protein
MIPYEIDPSLHTESREPLLDDGFSPPAQDATADAPARPSTVNTPPPVENLLWEKSGF